jgi:hypothetical protein
MGAFLASLAKGWVMKYAESSAENWSAAGPRQRRFRYRKRLQRLVQGLPLIIHASLFLFSAGLALYLKEDDIGLRATILFLVVGMGVGYITISLLPVISPSRYSPFDTPLSPIARWFLPRNSVRYDHVDKAQALAWLLKTSADRDAIRDAIQAIAVLPPDENVQKALLEPSVIRTMFGGFSECTKTGDHILLLSYLRAIHHLVRPSLPNSDQSRIIASLFIDPLEKFDVLERGIYEYALFIKACILELENRSLDNAKELIHTAMPIMAKCSMESVRELFSGKFSHGM